MRKKLREIAASDVLLALLSPGSHAFEICRSEQLLALDQGKRVIPVLVTKENLRPIYLYSRQFRDFSDTNRFTEQLAQLLDDIHGDATGTLSEDLRATKITYLTAPPRVANYLDRPAVLHALRDAVFAEDRRQPIALTTLAGMGGIGKTVLAKAPTDDPIVRRAFPDGIVWLTAGRETRRDFLAEMREVARALGEDPTDWDTSLACTNHYRTAIASKAALIVIDDVWSCTDIEPLLVESSRSRFLFTTRDAAIGRFLAAHEHPVDLLDHAPARELFASWANTPVSDLSPAADGIVRQCHGLPLALSMLGAIVRGESEEFLRDTLRLLETADISQLEMQLPAGQASFFKAVDLSFHALDATLQAYYRALAVLLEDMDAPPSILQILWNVDRAHAARIRKVLVDRSLAQPGVTGEGLHLHDLQLDYLRVLYGDRETLDLIHGAIRLSSHVIEKDPAQFASQIVGRLLMYRDRARIGAFRQLRQSGKSQGKSPCQFLVALQQGLLGVLPQGPGSIGALTRICSAYPVVDRGWHQPHSLGRLRFLTNDQQHFGESALLRRTESLDGGEGYVIQVKLTFECAHISGLLPDQLGVRVLHDARAVQTWLRRSSNEIFERL
jgi:hypothetical protein